MLVLKPITTPTRRIPAGVEITEAALDGPMTLADWQRLGHVEAPAPVAIAPELLAKAAKIPASAPAQREDD